MAFVTSGASLPASHPFTAWTRGDSSSLLLSSLFFGSFAAIAVASLLISWITAYRETRLTSPGANSRLKSGCRLNSYGAILFASDASIGSMTDVGEKKGPPFVVCVCVSAVFVVSTHRASKASVRFRRGIGFFSSGLVFTTASVTRSPIANFSESSVLAMLQIAVSQLGLFWQTTISVGCPDARLVAFLFALESEPKNENLAAAPPPTNEVVRVATENC
mmetsp:Transcript_2809/g.5980  ORF Transcript_2809/g.5980 Transcript_2809/m.5980 type:complete len:219 (-) Transcript_2809:146-802(-)